MDISEYANAIMAMIEDDISAGIVPASVASFSELHEHLDANMYSIEAGLLPVEDSDDPFWEINAVEREISRRLAARHG